MSFSLPLQALDDFQLMIHIPINSLPMRPSFELKSRPPDNFSKQDGVRILSSIYFEVIEEGNGPGLTLSVSREPASTPSEPSRALPNYEAENGTYLERPEQGSSLRDYDIVLDPPGQEGNDTDHLDMSLFMLPLDYTSTFSIFDSSQPHHTSFGDTTIANPPTGHGLPSTGSGQQYDNANQSLPSPPSLEQTRSPLLDPLFPASSLSASTSPSPTASSPCLSPNASPQNNPIDVLTSTESSSSSPRRRPRNFPCKEPDCNRSFTSSYTRDAHMLTHRPKDKKSYKCTVGCGAYFSRQHDRWRHEVTQHGKPSRWTCTRCLQYFSSKRRMEIHKNVCNAASV